VNVLERWWRLRLVGTAAKWRASGRLADAGYGALVVKTILEIAGQAVNEGDEVGPATFKVAADQILKPKPVEEARVAPYGSFSGVARKTFKRNALEATYGPYIEAPIFVRNTNGQHGGGVFWSATNEGDYQTVRAALFPPRRLESWLAGLKKHYPVLFGWVIQAFGWLVAALAGFAFGRILPR